MIMSCKNQICGLISFSLQVTGWSSNPSLTTSSQDKTKDHQCSFYNSYTFENIIRIGFRYHKIRKYHILSPTLGLTRVSRPYSDVLWRHPNLFSQANISHNHKQPQSRESSYLPICGLYLDLSIRAHSTT